MDTSPDMGRGDSRLRGNDVVVWGTAWGLSSIKVDKRGPPRESKERPAPRRSPDGTFKRRKSNQL